MPDVLLDAGLSIVLALVFLLIFECLGIFKD